MSSLFQLNLKAKIYSKPSQVSIFDDKNDSIPNNNRICRVCCRNSSFYACPTCFVPYCSSDCFKSHNNDCVEAFSRRKVSEVISFEKSMNKQDFSDSFNMNSLRGEILIYKPVIPSFDGSVTHIHGYSLISMYYSHDSLCIYSDILSSTNHTNVSSYQDIDHTSLNESHQRDDDDEDIDRSDDTLHELAAKLHDLNFKTQELSIKELDLLTRQVNKERLKLTQQHINSQSSTHANLFIPWWDNGNHVYLQSFDAIESLPHRWANASSVIRDKLRFEVNSRCNINRFKCSDDLVYHLFSISLSYVVLCRMYTTDLFQSMSPDINDDRRDDESMSDRVIEDTHKVRVHNDDNLATKHLYDLSTVHSFTEYQTVSSILSFNSFHEKKSADRDNLSNNTKHPNTIHEVIEYFNHKSSCLPGIQRLNVSRLNMVLKDVKKLINVKDYMFISVLESWFMSYMVLMDHNEELSPSDDVIEAAVRYYDVYSKPMMRTKDQLSMKTQLICRKLYFMMLFCLQDDFHEKLMNLSTSLNAYIDAYLAE